MSKTIIIAEAGVNHNGDLRKAKALIDVAFEAGADFVKFQSFKADKLVSRSAKKADYQISNMKDGDDGQYEMLKKLELSEGDHIELIEYCNKKGIKFLSTAFDVDGIDYLNDLGLELFKIPSGEITNYPYLKRLARIAKRVILSTGMSTIEEIKAAIQVLVSENLELNDITVLHCNTEYPTPYSDVNLKAMKTIGYECKVRIGYSDHTLGIEVPVAAVALGATVIEKHFTLDRSMEGPDHAASLEPDELLEMVKAIRNIEKAIGGTGKKEPSLSELKNISIARKSIHLARGVKKGKVLEESDLIPLRPGDGINPMDWERVVGKVVVHELNQYHKLTEADLK
ncbi:N-acetylneuraminate synthase [Marinoscillum furvescens]|uniref:N-acetylneuraminate synthase n=1 Tax=Marinoscillum furvescens DSM 4134 TaxID=1122208 RepID=A0A3D9L641_MARFU|nr:N-acetylneuraminate synthase [Marinoscillum furvescens]REE01640.1 N-acetylneuraminate synthase [Marinoscillum furvescens DSM 4134]